MNVLQVIDNSIYGGAERHTLFISTEFLKHGHRVTLVCPEGPFVREYRKIEDFGGRVVVIPDISRHYFNPLKVFHRRKFYRARKKLLEILKSEKFHLIHSHMHCADYLVASLSSAVQESVKITTLHNLEALDHHPVYRYIRKPFIVNAIKKFDFVFAISNTTAEIAKRYFRLPDHRLKVLRNAIDPEFLIPSMSPSEVRKKLGVNEGTFMFLCLGEYCERKNQITIIKAVKKLTEKSDKNFVVILAGLDKSGYGKRVLARAVKNLGLERRVILAGFWKDPASLLQACDAYLQPSLWDPLPRSLLEAMYFGKPCIASDIPGIRDVIINGRSGMLHSAEDSNSLAELMEEILSNSKQAAEFGEKAREIIMSGHLMTHMYKTIIETVEPFMKKEGLSGDLEGD